MISLAKNLLLTGALLGTLAFGTAASPAIAQQDPPGLADLDEAMRLRVTAEGLPGLNQVIELAQSALDKGLEVEDAELAESLLSDALMERATALIQVINTQSIAEEAVKRIVRLVISDLRRVLAYDNPPPLANFLLGRMMALPGGDHHEARRLLSKFLSAEDIPDDQRAEAFMLRARVQTDSDKAMADFDAAIELAPDNPNYRLIRALYLRGQDKLDEALAAIDRLLEESPEDANALILQGEVFRELEKFDEALKSFDEATELAPQAPSPFQNRGEIYREQGEYEQAIEQFTKVLELQPGSLLPLIHRAESYLFSGKLDESLADVEQVLQQQPLPAARRIRAEVFAQQNRLDDAIREIEQLAESLPNTAELKMQLGIYYLLNKQTSEAIRVYGEALEIDENNFLALRSRGDAYLNVGKHEEAIRDFERALELQADDPSLLNNFAWVLATSPDDELRDGKRAVELATKACELTDYEMPHILSTLAAGYAESGDFETAVEWSQKAVEMDDPDHSEQLAEELASYQQGEPWRERQTMDERGGSDTKQETPAGRVEAPQHSLDF